MKLVGGSVINVAIPSSYNSIPRVPLYNSCIGNLGDIHKAVAFMSSHGVRVCLMPPLLIINKYQLSVHSFQTSDLIYIWRYKIMFVGT